MKRFAMLVAVMLSATLTLFSCNSLYPPPANPVCDQPGMGNSLICQVCARYGTTPEQLQGVLLDGAAIAAITDPQSRGEICAFLEVVQEFYTPQMSWIDLVDMFEIGSEESILVAAVIQRRIPLEAFNSLELINQSDDYLLRESWRQHSDQLRCGR